MQMNSLMSSKIYLFILTLIAWFALGLQFGLSLARLNGDILATLEIYLSFFTILTNILVAICSTFLLSWNQTRWGRFFNKASTTTAIATYILVVGLIYNVALRGLVYQKGWDRVADELLHVVTPVLFLIFWFFFANKLHLAYKNAFTWLAYPSAYVLFIIIRGYLIQKYPYPFIDVVKIGYPAALLNTAIILIVFYLLSVLFIFLGKKISKA